jgi:hypothetical protein
MNFLTRVCLSPSRIRWAACVALGLLATFATSCGYVMCGTWEDDPKNWKRAFDFAKPDEIVVVHSKYWRSAHWSYECSWYFEIDPTPPVREKMFTENRLKRLSTEEAAQAKRDPGPQPPAWYAPKDIGRYEAWVYDDEQPQGNFKLFVDTESGHFFMNDYQL